MITKQISLDFCKTQGQNTGNYAKCGITFHAHFVYEKIQNFLKIRIYCVFFSDKFQLLRRKILITKNKQFASHLNILREYCNVDFVYVYKVIICIFLLLIYYVN